MRAKRAENFDLLTFAPPPPHPKKRTDAPAYGMALYTRHYTDKTLKLREIYEYASELNFLTFSQSKNCYFLHHFVGTADTFSQSQIKHLHT